MSENEATGVVIGDEAVNACMALIAERGWFGFTLRDVATRSGRDLPSLFCAYPSKLALLRGFLGALDASLLAGGAPGLDESARDRLFDVMMRRFDLLRPYRNAIDSMRRDLRRDPLTAMLLARAVERSMIAVLEAADLPADGVGGRLRRRGLMLVEARVVPVFCADDSADLGKTMSALDRHLKAGERWMAGLSRWLPRTRPAASDGSRSTNGTASP